MNSIFSGPKWLILTCWGRFWSRIPSSFDWYHCRVCRKLNKVTGAVWTRVRLNLADTVCVIKDLFFVDTLYYDLLWPTTTHCKQTKEIKSILSPYLILRAWHSCTVGLVILLFFIVILNVFSSKHFNIWTEFLFKTFLYLSSLNGWCLSFSLEFMVCIVWG